VSVVCVLRRALSERRRPSRCRGGRCRARRCDGESGQAALELLALVPLLLAVALAAAQLLAVGYSSVLAGNAAEAGALALAGGGDPRRSARTALPGWSRAGAQVSVAGGEVRVELRPPTLLRSLAAQLEVSASARVEAP
jgi:Flp pilus assembly protein TadG